MTAASSIKMITGNAVEIIQCFPESVFQSIITSPPYWGVRDYGHVKQIGRENTVDHYLASLIAVFSELLPKTKNNGTLWLNVGDVYTSGNRKWRAPDSKNPKRFMTSRPRNPDGLKPKELIGLPWRVAFAVQKAGWHLRAEIIWAKSNAMPESVNDRPTRTHEKIFLFSKNTHYLYNKSESLETNSQGTGKRNLRDIWVVNTEKSQNGHPAPFPFELARRCVELTSQPGDTILDPFAGTGTTGVAAATLKRDAILIDIDKACVKMARDRIKTLQANFTHLKSGRDIIHPPDEPPIA